MSGLLRIGSGNSAKPQIAGFKVQTSVAGLPIPLVYGTARVAGNLIDILDQKSSPTYSQPSHSKLVHVDAQQTGYSYKAAVVLALCEGPIDGVANVWADKNTAVTPASLGFDVSHLGTLSQATWTYLSTNHPSDGHAIPYQLVAYAADSSLDLPGNTLANYTWEIQGLKRFAPGSGIVDAAASDILTDYLTDQYHGAGWPTALLGSLTTYLNYIAALGVFLSPVEDSQRPAADFLSDLMKATNSALVWSDGLLKVIPYGDTSATGNGYTYTPNTTPLYDLTDDDYLPNGTDDPVLVTRKAAADRYNQVQVEYENRANNYNPDVAEAKDQGAIDTIAAATGGNGLRPMPKVTLHMIKDAATARLIAQLLLQREQYVCNTYTFRLGWRYSLLEPMDLVTLTDSGLGLSRTTVRITAVEELGNDDGLQITAEDWPFGVASATRYTTGSGAGYQPALNVSPGNTTSPVIFEGPSALQSSPLEIWIAATGGTNWGGCDVYVSTDNVNFLKVGTIVNKATFGTLSAALASGAGATLSVDLTPSSGSLVSYSATDYANLVSLCYVDGEFLAYETATLTSQYHYNLTTLTRGVYSSLIAASHSSGTNFVLCDGAVARLAFPQAKAGQTLYFKFPAFNVYGQALQDISTVSSVSHVVNGTPVVPGQGIDYTSNLTQTPTYHTAPTVDQVSMSWSWNGPAGATFDIYIEEPVPGTSTPGPYSLAAQGITSPYTYLPVNDIDPVGTAGLHANIGFKVVPRVGNTVFGESAKCEVVYNRN